MTVGLGYHPASISPTPSHPRATCRATSKPQFPHCQMGMTYDSLGKLRERWAVQEGCHDDKTCVPGLRRLGPGVDVGELLRAQCCSPGRRRGHFSGLLCPRETFQEWKTRHNHLNLRRTTKPSVKLECECHRCTEHCGGVLPFLPSACRGRLTVQPPLRASVCSGNTGPKGQVAKGGSRIQRPFLGLPLPPASPPEYQ